MKEEGEIRNSWQVPVQNEVLALQQGEMRGEEMQEVSD